MIPNAVPTLGGNEWKYIKECLDTSWVSSAGRFVNEFEKEIAAYLGVGHAIAVSSGTAAIHIALLVAGVQPGDQVLVPTLTFMGTVSPVTYCGATPVFIDVEPASWGMDPAKLRHYLTTHADVDPSTGQAHDRESGQRIAAMLPVHLYGHPAPMAELLSAAGEFGIEVVEDAAESLGARYEGTHMGAMGRLGCLSFNGNKIITSGGGGAIVTDDDALAERAHYLSNTARDDHVEFLHNEVGYNYRMSNIHAALGLAQLERIDEFVAAKRAHREKYADALHGVPGIDVPREESWATSSYWMTSILVDEAEFGMDSRALLRILADAQIQARPLFKPLHTQSPMLQFPRGDVTVAEGLYARALNLPSSVGLTDGEIEQVAEAIRQARKG